MAAAIGGAFSFPFLSSIEELQFLTRARTHNSHIVCVQPQASFLLSLRHILFLLVYYAVHAFAHVHTFAHSHRFGSIDTFQFTFLLKKKT